MSIIQFSKTNPLQAMTGVAKAIALPHETHPVRFPSFPALERTAVMAFTQPLNISLPAMTNGESYRGFLARQAAYPLWMECLASNLVYGVSYAMNYGEAASGATVMVGNAVNKPTCVNRTGDNYTVAVANSVPPACGNAIMGMDAGTGPRPWMYFPPNCKAWFILTTSAPFSADPLAALTWEVWNSPGEVSVQSSVPMSWVAGQWNLSATVPTDVGSGVWVRPVSVEFGGTFTPHTYANASNFISVFVTTGPSNYTNSNTSAGTITGSNTAIKTMLPLVAPSELVNSQVPWFATRTTAAAFLATNVTQVLNKAGTVLAGRVSPAVYSPWSVTSGYVTNLHPAEKANLGLEHGFYTYCPPSTDLAQFYDYTLPGYPTVAVYRLDNDSLYNWFAFTDAVASNFALNVDWHMEFRNSSALFEVGLSSMTLESLHQAQLSLVEHGFFFNNEDHKHDISTIVGGISKYAKRFAPTAVGLVNPTAGRLLQSVLSRSTSVSKSPLPKPTSMIPTQTSKGAPPKKKGGGPPKKGKGKGKGKK